MKFDRNRVYNLLNVSGLQKGDLVLVSDSLLVLKKDVEEFNSFVYRVVDTCEDADECTAVGKHPHAFRYAYLIMRAEDPRGEALLEWWNHGRLTAYNGDSLLTELSFDEALESSNEWEVIEGNPIEWDEDLIDKASSLSREINKKRREAENLLNELKVIFIKTETDFTPVIGENGEVEYRYPADLPTVEITHSLGECIADWGADKDPGKALHLVEYCHKEEA